MPVSLDSAYDLLQPGLNKITGMYDAIETQYSKVFTKRNSNMAAERSVQVAFLGAAQYKSEGGQTSFDNNAGQRYVYNCVHDEVGLGYAITRPAIDDNLYKAQFKPTNLGLQRSFKEFKESQAAALFNNGTTVDTELGGDGKAWFDTAHPVDGTTIANTPAVQVDLNESSLAAAQIAIRSNWVDERGLKISARAKKVLVPPALQQVIIRLQETELRPGTANNDVNTIMRMDDGAMGKFMVWDYLTSTRAWFVLTDVEDSIILMQRMPYETDMQVDFTTDNLLVKGYERYKFTRNDWRGAYASFPTS